MPASGGSQRRGHPWRTVLAIARIALLSLAGFAVLVFFLQDRMIYHPRPYAAGEAVGLAGGEVVEIRYGTAAGAGLAHYLPPRSGGPPERVWLVCGGNGARALDYAPVTGGWDSRWGYLFVDYPGYGGCDGKPTPGSIDSAVDAAIARWHEGHEGRLSGFGHSIGCAATLRAAVRHGFEEVVLVSPFTSMLAMARRAVGWPMCQLLRHRFDNVEALGQLDPTRVRVTVFHGAQDRQIPVAMSRELARQFPGLIRYHELPYADHNAIVHDFARPIGEAMQGAPIAGKGE